MIQICYANIRLGKVSLRDLCNTLPENILINCNRFNFQDDKMRYVFGRLMLKKLFKKKGIPIELDNLEYTIYGKPFLPNALEFNISHSGDYVFVAISDKAIGIDIEKISDINPETFDIILSQKEKCAIKISQTPIELFYEIWTKKEAVLKANGMGFTNRSNEIDTLDFKISVQDTIYYIKEINIDVNYKCHVAYSAMNEKIELFEISIDDLMGY